MYIYVLFMSAKNIYKVFCIKCIAVRELTGLILLLAWINGKLIWHCCISCMLFGPSLLANETWIGRYSFITVLLT